MKGWWFCCADDKLGYGDGRKAAVGITHEVDGEPVLCERGLHASTTVQDALSYAPGPILYRVELGGVIVRGDDKAAATKRTYIARIDATDVLRRFARACALDVIEHWNAPDVVLRYLKSGDESLRDAAWAAAWDAAWAAAGAAAWAAARDAAWAAARDAARDAAWAAARDAAWAAAWDAAWAAAWDAQKARLASMVSAEFRRQA